MTFRTFAVASVGAAVVGSSASAAIISFSQQGVWNAYVAFQSLTVVTEDFNSIPDGPYASGYTDSAGPITWSASAIGDLFVQGGLFSTNAPETLTFQFSPGVQGVSGNFFGTDVNFNPVPSLVQVTLADGTSSILLATAPPTSPASSRPAPPSAACPSPPPAAAWSSRPWTTRSTTCTSASPRRASSRCLALPGSSASAFAGAEPDVQGTTITCARAASRRPCALNVGSATVRKNRST